MRNLTLGIGAVGIVAACGGSSDTSGNFVPATTNTGSPGFNSSGNSSGASNSGDSSGNGGNSGSTSGSAGAANPGDDGGTCTQSCSADMDCQLACGSPASGGIYCCNSGTCFANSASACDSGDAGSTGDDSSPSTAPST